MSVSIDIDHVVKKYGSNTVINGLSLSVKPGEFFTLLGPSGCGKTTLLRMIIGFNSIEGGTISVGGRVMNDVSPDKRNMGMVSRTMPYFPICLSETMWPLAFVCGISRKRTLKNEWIIC